MQINFLRIWSNKIRGMMQIDFLRIWSNKIDGMGGNKKVLKGRIR